MSSDAFRSGIALHGNYVLLGFSMALIEWRKKPMHRYDFRNVSLLIERDGMRTNITQIDSFEYLIVAIKSDI